MDRKFKKWYRGRYEEMESAPPEEVWANITQKLDSERDEKKRRFLIYFSASLLFIVSLSTWHFVDWRGNEFANQFSKYDWKMRGHRVTLAENTKPVSSANNHRKPAQESNTRVQHPDFVAVPQVAKEEERAGEFFSVMRDEKSEASVAAKEGTNLAGEVENSENIPEVARKDVLVSLPAGLKNLDAEIQNTPTDSPSVAPTYQRFHIGTTINYANTWVVNANLWDASHINSLNYVVPYYSASASLLAGYSFNKRKSVFVELGRHAIGQKYYAFEEGHATSYNLELKYLHVNSYLSFNSKPRNLGKNTRSWFSLQAGIHAGYLLSAMQSKGNSKALTVHDDYRSIDAGVLASGACIMQWKHIGLTAGLRCNVGLLNVYSGSEETPLSLNKTYNESISLFSSLFYSF